MGAFRQHLDAHCGPARAGVAGPPNVLALEGDSHSIRANAVLPIGRPRMMTDSIEGRDPDAIRDALFAETTAERVVPVVLHLASSDRQVTKDFYFATAGRVSRVFVGLTEGWLGHRDTELTAEDISAHIDEIDSTRTSPFLAARPTRSSACSSASASSDAGHHPTTQSLHGDVSRAESLQL